MKSTIIEIFKKYFIGIFALIFYLFLKFLNPEYIYDYLNLTSLNSTAYFELLISSTASIFGILIAVILLTFEFVKHSAFRRKDRNILTKSVVTNLVATAVSVIILSLISYSTIPDFKQTNNLSIAYFLGFLFMGFIISIYPAAKGIIETANTLKKTRDEIQNLTYEKFAEILTLQNDKFISNNNDLALIRIKSELITSVRECDYEANTTILQELNIKVIDLITKSQNSHLTDNVFQGISVIWNSGKSEALRVGNNQFYETIWESIQQLYEHAAKEKISLIKYKFINSFVREFINFLSRNKLFDSLSLGIKALSISFKYNLKFNCPPQEEISDLYLIFDDKNYIQHNSNSSLQWEAINEFIDLIQVIQSIAINVGDKELFETSTSELGDIISKIGYGELGNLKPYQEAVIVSDIIVNQIHNGFNANETNLFKDTLKTFRIDVKFISDLIKNNKFYFKKILTIISDFIINSQRKKRLNNYFTLNKWGALGRNISKAYLNNQTIQEAMDFILDTFDKLKEEIEKNQLPDQVENYNEIQKQLKSIMTFLLQDNVEKEANVIKRIEKTLKEFKVIKEPNDFNIVK